MPLATKTFAPALAAFITLSFSYTAYEAHHEGNTMDAARTRWQQQKARGEAAYTTAFGTPHH